MAEPAVSTLKEEAPVTARPVVAESSHAAKMATDKLTAMYGKFTAVKGVSLAFVPNQVHALFENGWITGRVLLDGEDIYAPRINAMHLRRRVGMVFQKPTPFPTMSIYDNVASGLRVNRRLPRQELDSLIERSLRQAALWDEVKDRLSASAMALSGGQQQRLCIARTIAPSPDVILLDEPTASLDPQGTQRIEELLFDLKRHFTIVIVTHNMQQAARVSDTTTFFYLGTMVETGATRQIFTAPRNEQTEAYITGRFG